MRDELAERLFASLMGEGPDDVLLTDARPLQRMASYKYDEYGGFSPGVKFLESLVTWIAQFDSAERPVAMKFVREELLFLSNREIYHALSLSYQDLVRPMLIRKCAAAMSVEPWRVEKILASEEFRIEQRSTLFMGLADGARLDQFRRSNPALVHDQFSSVAELPRRVAFSMRSDLNGDLNARANGNHGLSRFRRFVLVDDFSGSGFTMLRSDAGGGWKGKLARFKVHVDELKSWGVAEDDTEVHVLLYVATDSAREYLTRRIDDTGWGWELSIVQQIPTSTLLDRQSEFADLCRKYHDPIVDDSIKANADSGSSALGFRDGRLPLVLTHNTPNNSVGLLWENTMDYPKSNLKRSALFPRHERHKADR